MKWAEEAESAVSHVPFFVRKRIKKRVEEEAVKQGSRQVNIEHVRACQKWYLNNMEEDVSRIPGRDLFWAVRLSQQSC